MPVEKPFFGEWFIILLSGVKDHFDNAIDIPIMGI